MEVPIIIIIIIIIIIVSGSVHRGKQRRGQRPDRGGERERERERERALTGSRSPNRTLGTRSGPQEYSYTNIILMQCISKRAAHGHSSLNKMQR
jgi:hypothetical protein